MITTKDFLAYILQAITSIAPNLDTTNVDMEQVYCLAKNVYYESRNEDIRGQFAVASVTLNRVEDPRYPSTVCDVVKQVTISNKTKKPVCQFSWYCEKDKQGIDIPIKNKNGTINQRVVDQFQVATFVALSALNGKIEDNTNGATHFHNPFTSKPPWRHNLKRTMRVGNHDFYKYPNYKYQE